MAVLNVAVIGDLHLDGMTADLGPDANRLQVAEVGKAEAWAVRNGIDEIWYVGDLSNGVVMSYDAHELLWAQWRLYPHLRRRVIVGNHDFEELGRHSLRLLKKMAEHGNLPNVFIYDEPTREVLDGVPVNFLPYPYPYLQPDQKVCTKNAINVSHFEVGGAVRDNGSVSRSDTDVEGTWIMGHLHTPQDLGAPKGKPNSTRRVHYVGTLYQRNFGESLPKSFTHLQARMHEGKLQTKLRRIDHDPAFKLINLDVQTAADLKKVTRNPLHKYKLFISAAVKVPDQFLADHPNVVRDQRYRNKRERDVLVEQKMVVSQECAQDDPFDSLGDYLEVRHPELTKAQRQRALKISEEIRAGLQYAAGLFAQ